MNTSTDEITVIFKKDKSSKEVVAFFPYLFNSWTGEFTCYCHVGQHSNCCLNYYLYNCNNCSKEEYSSLYNELIMRGYNLKVAKKINYTKFRNSYNSFLKQQEYISLHEKVEKSLPCT